MFNYKAGLKSNALQSHGLIEKAGKLSVDKTQKTYSFCIPLHLHGLGSGRKPTPSAPKH